MVVVVVVVVMVMMMIIHDGPTGAAVADRIRDSGGVASNVQ